MAVSNLLVAIPYASWVTFPYDLSAISSNFEAVGVVPSFRFIPHETEKCHVNRSHTELEGFKMETEVLTKTVENLARMKIRQLLLYLINQAVILEFSLSS